MHRLFMRSVENRNKLYWKLWNSIWNFSFDASFWNLMFLMFILWRTLSRTRSNNKRHYLSLCLRRKVKSKELFLALLLSVNKRYWSLQNFLRTRDSFHGRMSFLTYNYI